MTSAAKPSDAAPGIGPQPDAALLERLRAMDGQCNSSVTRKAARYLSAAYDRVLAPSGLRTTQFTILRKLALADRASISGLAEAIAMDRTTLAANLKPLERDGLLAIGPDPKDQRARTVTITETGLGKLNEAAPLWQTAQDRFEGAFGPRKAAALRAALSGVLDTRLDPWGA